MVDLKALYVCMVDLKALCVCMVDLNLLMALYHVCVCLI